MPSEAQNFDADLGNPVQPMIIGKKRKKFIHTCCKPPPDLRCKGGMAFHIVDHDDGVEIQAHPMLLPRIALTFDPGINLSGAEGYMTFGL